MGCGTFILVMTWTAGMCLGRTGMLTPAVANEAVGDELPQHSAGRRRRSTERELGEGAWEL